MRKKYFKYLFFVIVFQQTSCKNFLGVDPPKSSLVQSTVFDNNDQATSAVIGIYATMSASGYASGGSGSISNQAGMSSDDLVGYSALNIPFYQNALTPDLSSLQALYSGLYKTIYAANAVLEGLSGSNGVTPPVKVQLQGEVMFIRAFAYFYLVNLYGAVPLQLTTDYRITQMEPRTPSKQVYEQIIADLMNAENLLTESYPTVGRVRPNKSAVWAMLSRTYLYLKDWVNAEKYASLVISKTTYSLVDINSVFLANSQEAIWQLMPAANSNTQDGLNFILTAAPTSVSLNSNFVNNAFEANDRRRSSWINSLTIGTQTYFYPFKYKVRSSTAVTEYSMVLRLAEQYLIRAEARINQAGKIEEGISDLNIIRTRARPSSTASMPNPLPALDPNLDKPLALLAVEQERRVELFTEWGHRWLDLSRTGRANEILSTVKSNWQQTDLLYPIPFDERSRNPAITQNPGYLDNL
ncbi:RagB/SusD family nutrient uptake outer membrane protein [Pedobacter sp. MC2016-14]|uniref:RagB/SusD family nutrient uptake outer membrane protein n=1 Tax=Pedobacter sp. MC2016-14 TaxID=2897327 RepID=UPI001E38F81C|nr:RagB/SusD family nutrient uptake outer membrane protein [Pedobacter sp. MC2016-14]MCD0488319.1 RagB/SusD family nutrient uptake outer membrane protein [Pedobacter sp. MC2016-14]